MVRHPTTRFVTNQASRTLNVWCLVLVVLVGVFLGTSIYLRFLANWRVHWDGIVHDRNAHGAISMKMALALQQGNWLRLASEIEKCRVWPPVYDVLAAFTMAIGRVDFRIGVLPSLAGWLMTLVFGFLIVRRLMQNELVGNFAGVMAVLFIAASPAHRSYATDMMLESLGSGLTLLALYLYVVARQKPTEFQDWRPFAIAMTVLFFEKYNYWMIVVLALIADTVWLGRREYFSTAREIPLLPWGKIVRHQLRRPLCYFYLCLFGLIVTIYVNAPISFHVAGRRVSLSASGNFITVTYAIVFFCIVHELRVNWHQWWPRLAKSQQQLLVFHTLPIAVSFLLPHRLGAFLWYMRPNHYGESAPRDPLGAAGFYLRCAAEDYHVGAWSLGIALVAFAIAVVWHRRLRREFLCVLLMVMIGAVLVVIHPNQKSRFLHSWLPGFWLASAAGIALLLSLRPLVSRWQSQLGVAGLVIGVMTYFHGSLSRTVGHSPELGHRQSNISQFDLTDTYLPYLRNSQRIAFLSTMPCGGLTESTYLQRYGRLEAVELPILDQLTRAEIEGQFSAWLQSTQADTLVMLDIPPGSYFYAEIGCNYENYRMLLERLEQQTKFQLSHTWRNERYGCSITLWRRGENPTAHSP